MLEDDERLCRLPHNYQVFYSSVERLGSGEPQEGVQLTVCECLHVDSVGYSNATLANFRTDDVLRNWKVAVVSLAL